MPDSHLLTTAEVAAYLRIKERKVYDLVSDGRIPCTRVTGKLLFPKPLIDLWIAAETDGASGAIRQRPPIAAGSHDPLLDWALRESGCGIATLFDGSLNGLEKYLAGAALFCGMHVPDPSGGEPNCHLLNAGGGAGRAVMIEWATRTQGLILPPGNPKGISGLSDLPEKHVRLKLRQAQAGSRMLLDQLMRAADLDPMDLPACSKVARSETDAATSVADGAADAAFGIEAVAKRFGLAFVPLARERFDIAIDRRDYFEPPFQTLLAFTGTNRFREEAARLGGYDIAALGRVVFNG